ncbi:MAG: EamA family transporter, partial [Actinomycetota bacterium]|nr:EamA family transporter [Actinomycetota bacterium]
MTGGVAARPAAAPGRMWAALATVYVVWGSTYLAIRVLVQSAPPLLGMGTRFLVAGVVLAGLLAARRGPRTLRVRPRQLAAAGLVGGLFFILGNGLV